MESSPEPTDAFSAAPETQDGCRTCYSGWEPDEIRTICNGSVLLFGSMPSIRSFRDFLVWQKSMDLALVSEQQAAGSIGDAEQIGRMLHGLVLSLRRRG